jgi:Tol biopolymer transport system component
VRKSRVALLIGTAVMLFTSCATEKPARESKFQPEEAVVPKREESRREIQLDYAELELEILDIEQVEKKPGLFNSYNPQFSADERYLAFEVNLGNYKKIYIYQIDVEKRAGEFDLLFRKVKEVYLDEALDGELTDALFESSLGESFNYEFSWFPASSSFIFTSNAGLGEYNIFIGSVEDGDSLLRDIRKRINPKQYGNYYMMTEEIRKDGQAKVSPDGSRIVFTSARTGNGDLYLLDLYTNMLKRLTSSEDTDFFPRWSPEGRDIAYTTGGKEAHDIHIIRNAGTPEQVDEVLVRWFFDDVLPSYSPDGRYISFYTTYNLERDPFNTKRWGIMIVPSDGSAPKAGEALISYFRVPDVIKDNSQGAAWFPDSRHIIFAKNIDSDYNPIYIYNVEERTEKLVETGTDINHDITVSPRGLVAFRAQLFGWDRVFAASSSYFQEYLRELYGE